MLKAFFKRIKSQKGMSGVLVALLLVVVGVGLVAAVNTFMNKNYTTIETQAQTNIDDALNPPTTAP